MNPYLVLNIYSLILLIALMVIFFRKQRIHASEDITYSYLLITLCITCIFGIINSMLFSFHFDLQELLIKTFGKLYLAGLFIIFYSFTFYSILLSKKKEIKIGNILALIVSILIILLPLDLKYSGNEILIEGLASNFAYLSFGVCYLIMILSILTAKGEKIKLLPVLLLIFTGIGALIIQSYVENINYYINPAIVFIVLIMYHTIENPDLKTITALNEAKLSAEKANRAKSDFLSNMSHEIRTPLNAIVGFSDCILEEENLSDAKSDAKDIKLASENLLEIVNGILDISKIEADKMEIVETDYNIVEVLDNVSKLVKPRIGEKPIEFNVKFAPDIPYMVYGDGGKLRQIVTNILTNAIKYTEKGSISFIVNCVNDNEYCKLIVSVEDTGRGIKTEQIDKLFTKFQRLDEDKNTTLEGTGLGLAITKSFVEMMGGKIVVQSKYGEGSKFTVYLRQKIIKMNKPDNASESELLNTSKMKLFDFSSSRILVVDDNKINIKVALKLLSNYGIKAEASESGFDALKRLESGEVYDLILLDDMMPKMSGVETLAKIRETVIYDMPVIALTANALSGMKEKYLADGFDDYLSKPIEKNELYRILINYLHKKMSVMDIPAVKKSVKKVEEEKEDKNVDNTFNDTTKKTILVVDDNKINIKIVTKLLNDKNVLIDSALSGKEAIDKCKDNNYDLIFMDIMMPEMDGVEAMHHIKNDLNFKNPIIALTADAVEGSKEKYLSEGFDEYLSKPINNEIIDKTLDKFLH